MIAPKESVMDEKMNRIVKSFKKGFFVDPIVYCFEKEDKLAFENIKPLLIENGFKLIDIDQSTNFGDVAKSIDDKTVLVVEYNDKIISNSPAYERIRSLLKDGTSSLRCIRAIVYLETTEKINDFCLYGVTF